MLGNDVVDLRDPESRPETFRPRFDERVFTEREREAIARDAHPLARRWAHWAAKEAAYKLARQVDPDFVFSPSRLEARFEPVSNLVGRRRERRGRLELPRTLGRVIRELDLRSIESEDRVHVIALPKGSDWGAVSHAVEAFASDATSPGEAVRALAIEGIARSLGVTPERLRIGRQGRIPTVELDGRRTSLALSLSHHGRWIAYAMTPRIEPAAAAAGRPGEGSARRAPLERSR